MTATRSTGEQVGVAVLEILPKGCGCGESVEPVEVADGGDLVELLGVGLNPDSDFVAGVGGEGEVHGAQETGLHAGRDLPSAAAGVGGVDETAPVVDDVLEGPARPGDALAERVPAAAEHVCALDVGQPRHVGQQVGGALLPGDAEQHPVGAADAYLVAQQAELGFVRGGIDVAHACVEQGGELVRAGDRGLVGALLGADQAPGRDGVGPGCELRSAFEAAEVGDDPDEDLLRRVFGVLRMAEETQREPVHGVLQLAGVSTDYYTRLERGNATGVSDSVVDGVVRALQLDEAERNHLCDLIRTSGDSGPPRRRPTSRREIRPTVQRVVDSMHATPAVVSNGRLDILHANALGRALFAPVFAFADPNRPPNSARFVFLDPAAKALYRLWDAVADDTVALLRVEAGRDPHDRQLSELIGQLSMRSTEFRTRWAAHDVRIHTSGVKLVHHPVVGDLDLPYESFLLPAEPSVSLVTYTAEPGSPSEDALNLLASWTATNDAIAAHAQTD